MFGKIIYNKTLGSKDAYNHKHTGRNITLKKIVNIVLMAAAAAVLAGCSPSTITNEETSYIPDGAVIPSEAETTWTLPETKEYVIPENAPTGEAGGPGAMETTAVDYSMYPKDKQPVAAEPGDENKTLVILYRQTDLGLSQDFDSVDTCDADSLIEALSKNGAFKEGSKVTEFTVDDDKVGHLKLDKLDIYSTRDEDVVVAGIANTFIDNLQLKALELTVGDKSYGTLEFNTEY